MILPNSLPFKKAGHSNCRKANVCNDEEDIGPI